MKASESRRMRRQYPTEARDALIEARLERQRLQQPGVRAMDVAKTLGCAPGWAAIELKIALLLLAQARDTATGDTAPGDTAPTGAAK